ncbi:WbqC family protein [Candidatus Synechococcus calcipolaris G9]|uniref:WbqC family protein n=1 Tax=Candidatus Synechococcus calcipolaris G9 TaxID=1497997 RepID=A0ABT6F3G6_9SYNE|nr:WbqC family protein [Candidatus Synechococcus calcipolaris]MDG2992411.1 WbqC family protein [Candidatus Synechococcus calcipolaris G9]
MKVVILQSNYIPWKGYFDLINDADFFCFLDEVQYTKNDWRNRNKLYSKNGIFWLTIPINKKSVNLKISEVTLEDFHWQEKHFKTIIHTYCKSPQFNEIIYFLEDIYLKHKWNFLSDLNQYIIMKICKYSKITTQFADSRHFSLELDRVDRLISIIKQVGGTEYISGIAAKKYLDGQEEKFSQNNIKLIYKAYGPYKQYFQNLPIFENFVSIIDTLMFVPQSDILKYIVSEN